MRALTAEGEAVRSHHIERRQPAGAPAREIITFAEHAGADLTATGSHGYHVAERILVGSVAARWPRASRCSVLLAPSSATVVEREVAWRAEQRVMRGAGDRTLPGARYSCSRSGLSN